MFLQCLYAMGSTVGFCLVLNVRKQDILFCGLGGFLGWAVYLLGVSRGFGIVPQYLFATITIMLYSELMAMVRKTPSTVFLIPSIIPYVPGGAMYNTMRYWFLGERDLFFETASQALTIAGSIAMGIMLGTMFWRLGRNIIRITRESRLEKKK